MNIENRVRQIVREEISARLPAVPASQTAIELPLRPGEVERQYPVSETARLLGMSRDWVYDRIDDGTFVVANFGTGKSKRRIPASSINAYIKAHTFAAGQ